MVFGKRPIGVTFGTLQWKKVKKIRSEHETITESKSFFPYYGRLEKS
jgi:hypothetical protein